MKKLQLFILIWSIFFLSSTNPSKAFAIENPLAVTNNKIGIHILFNNELKAASNLVNSTNGDWGYITTVIQAGDKNIEKWQAFMSDAKKYHLIPIIRLSTEGDPQNTSVWRKPTDADIIDFANFLDSLDWPVKNRYVIIFNEVNRGDEWGGSANPGEYAQTLSYAITVFKSKSPDYFILPAGLDNAAPNQNSLYINEYTFMRQMNLSVPGIFNQIDGLTSHSYPNPGFLQPPSVNSPSGINSFQYERQLVKSLSLKDLPVFITETGWSTDSVTELSAANYYIAALNTVWTDPGIAAITPFLLQGTGGPFQKFSFFGKNDTLTKQYNAIHNFPKTKGNPTISKVLGTEISPESTTKPERDFSGFKPVNHKIIISNELKDVFKWLLKL